MYQSIPITIGDVLDHPILMNRDTIMHKEGTKSKMNFCICSVTFQDLIFKRK